MFNQEPRIDAIPSAKSVQSAAADSRNSSDVFSSRRSELLPRIWAMARWLKYLNERSPLIPSLILSAGIAASGQAIAGRWMLAGFLLETLLLMVVFVLLRLMDEIKDLEKDRVLILNGRCREVCWPSPKLNGRSAS